VPLNAIWGHRAAEMREQLYAAPTLQAGFALLERFLLARLWDAPRGFDVVHYAVAEIARQNGALSIRGLSEHIGISENHLATHFKRIIGIPPKELARFYRFARALHLIILTQSVNWARIARQSSFYDQSHFIKEFLVFTGHTPTDYLRLRRHLHSQNPEQAKSLGQMPID
jgi:AraC-like DNA-binding protein